uniref:DNA-binding protein RFX5 n=1 Tax=Lygus hesperus TaxID=30085 RepID=A0A146KYP4_LYGHE
MLYCEQSVGPSSSLTSASDMGAPATPKISRISDVFPEAEPPMIRARLHHSGDLQNILENSLEMQSVATVDDILDAVDQLAPLEKLLLYLKLPTGKTVQDPLKQPTNPLGSRPEISLTVSWIKTHLQEDTKTSLPKQDVYNEYLEYCRMNEMKPLSTADFGKVMKQVYPNMRPRRLGTRGNSRYCYSGLSSRASLPTPTLPILPSLDGTIVCRWAAKVLGQEESFSSIADLEHHLLDNNLVPKKTSPSNFDATCTNDKSYAMSSKICRPPDKRPDDKRKLQDESPSTSKGAPERCKGKRSNSASSAVATPVKKGTGKRSVAPTPTPTPTPASTPVTPVTPVTPITPAEDMIVSPAGSTSDIGVLTKLPIPRLPKIPTNKPFTNTNPLPVIKRHKPIVPKDLIGDSNNSLEQEEELLNYFRRQGDDESKGSTLRMLLERSKDSANGGNATGGKSISISTSTASSAAVPGTSVRSSSTGVNTGATMRRRVSFDPPPPPDTPKKFSFVPISPISPHSPQFVTPQTPSSLPSPHFRSASVADPPLSAAVLTTCASTSSSDAPLLHTILNNPHQMYSSGTWRSQSVPACTLPDLTPVPSEPTDFDMTESDSSNLLDSDSLGGPDNLGQILSYISELDSPTVLKGDIDPSYGEDQVESKSSYSNSYPPISALLDASTDLFEDSLSLDCDDAFSSIAREVISQPKNF